MANITKKPQLNGNIIADTSIRQPVFITMLMLLAIVIGLLAYRSLPVNLLPDISVPVVAVTLTYPGAGPESVAEQVAKPVENALNTINGIKHITSNSSEGIATILLEFQSNVNVDRAEQDVREKVNQIKPTLPNDVRDPVFSKFDPNDSPVLTVAVASDGSLTPLQLRQLVDNDLVPLIQQVQGVGSVTANGGQVRQINVQMDLRKLTSYGILPVQISNAIRNANSTYGLGTINAGDRDVSLRVPSQLATPEDIARIQITGTPYRVGDVATVEDGVAEVKSYSRLDGKDAVSLAIRKQSGTNTVQVADNAKAVLAKFFASRPNLRYFLPSDQSDAVRSSVDSAIEELIVAAVAAMLVVLLFFRDLRNTLTTVAGLPVIMIFTFALLSYFGLSINLITLLALSLSVGLVIDDAIVVRENIFRHMERGETPMVAASRGTAEVSLSVLAMTLTIISVFLPVTFTTGVTGIVFYSFGITVAAAMAISLVEAFTLAPMLSAYLFKQQTPKPGTAPVQHAAADLEAEASDYNHALEEAREETGPLGRWYGRMLRWILATRGHRLLVVGVALAVLFISGVVAIQLKFSFFPKQDNHLFVASFEQPPGTPLATTDQIARQVEAILLKDPGVAAVLSTVGSAGSTERAEFSVRVRKDTPTDTVQARLRTQIESIPGIQRVALGQPSFTGSSTAVQNRPLVLSIQSTRPVNEFAPLLQPLRGQAEGIPGLTDIDTSYTPGKPELVFHVDPAKTGDLGVTNDDIARSVRALINGDTATTFRQNGQDTDVVVRLRPGDRASTDDLQAISVPTRGGSVPLSALVRAELSSSPTTIRRYDRLNQILIGANVVGRNVNDVQRDIQARLQSFQSTLPPEVSKDLIFTFQGQTQQQQEGFDTLFIAMGLSVLFVYMVLASQFGSFLQPLLIMTAMPFSFIGAFLALLLTGIELDITGMIGLIMLLGLVTKNSILLVDFTNRLRRAGLEKHQAIELAGAVRLRPIMMTTLAIIAGALPTALGLHLFGSGQGSEFRRGLAIVLIGGLTTSFFLTLLVVPTGYSLLDSFTTWLGRLFRRRGALEAAPTAAAPADAVAGNGAATDGVAADGAPRRDANGVARPQVEG
jgi:HAE1 family hydrophobic/amphiphilic exporter-1